MRKFILFSLLLVVIPCLILSISIVPKASAGTSDWDEYQSGRNNIYLEGYAGVPGYIVFGDGNNTSASKVVLWYDPSRGLVMSSYDRIGDTWSTTGGVHASSYAWDTV